MKGTLSGVLPDPATPTPSKGSFWKRKRTLTTRALVGICLGAALLGGIVEKAGMDDKMADLQAQVSALQDATDTTGGGSVTVASLKGSSKVQHPKALSPSQHKYTCTRN